jgi:hypothetical protein
MLILHVLFLACVGLVLLAFTFLWVIEMLDKVSTLREYAPWLVAFAEHKKWHAVVLLICWVFLSVDGAELYFKEVPEIPAPPTVTIKSPPAPAVTINQITPPTKERCWVRNYATPAMSGPAKWGLATILCNMTIKPPYSVEVDYDQGVTVGPFTFPVGSEFSKYQEHNQGTKVVAMFDVHTIIPNEPFSIMAQGSGDKFPLVTGATIRAKGLVLELHP